LQNNAYTEFKFYKYLQIATTVITLSLKLQDWRSTNFTKEKWLGYAG